MWSNPPPEVTALRTMLLASTTFTTWGFASGNVHYPSVGLGGSASPDALPTALIEPLEKTPRTLAPGIVLPGGRLQVVLRVAAADAASVEANAWAICDELIQQHTGLPITDARVGMTAEPTADDLAAQEYADQQVTGQKFAIWTIGINITYGIT